MTIDPAGYAAALNAWHSTDSTNEVALTAALEAYLMTVSPVWVQPVPVGSIVTLRLPEEAHTEQEIEWLRQSITNAAGHDRFVLIMLPPA